MLESKATSVSFAVAIVAVLGLVVYDAITIFQIATTGGGSDVIANPMTWPVLMPILLFVLLQVGIVQGGYVFIVYLLKKWHLVGFILHSIATPIVFISLLSALFGATNRMNLPVDSPLPLVVTAILFIGIPVLAYNDYKYKRLEIA